MGDDEKHSIRNGILATVIGGLILSSIGYILFFVPSWVRWVADLIARVWNYFVASASIPRWLLWLLVFFSLATVIRLLLPLFKSRSNEPKLSMYTQDTFFGAIWRWPFPFNNLLEKIRGYCPYCDTMLVYQEHFERYEPTKTSFYCESCRRSIVELEGDKEYVTAMIARQIDRKIRTGEWKAVVTAPSNNSFNRSAG